jgi:uncharacterized cupin superfamily protein
VAQSTGLRKVRALRGVDAALSPWPGTNEGVLEGVLDVRAQTLWSSPDGTAENGIWRAEPVRLRLVHPFDETFVILAGRLTVTPEDDPEPRELGAGDVIVLAEGTVCEWTIHEAVTKLYSIYRREGLPGQDGARPETEEVER